MKKIFVFVIASLLVFCLAACGSESATEASSDSENTIPSVEIKENEFESRDDSDVPTLNTDIGGDGEEQTSAFDDAEDDIITNGGDSGNNDQPVIDGADNADSQIDSVD